MYARPDGEQSLDGSGARGVGLLERIAKVPKPLHGDVKEQVVFILEIQIDRCRGVPCRSCHLAQGEHVIPVLQKELDGGVEDGPPGILPIRAGRGKRSSCFSPGTTASRFAHDGFILLNSVN